MVGCDEGAISDSQPPPEIQSEFSIVVGRVNSLIVILCDNGFQDFVNDESIAIRHPEVRLAEPPFPSFVSVKLNLILSAGWSVVLFGAACFTLAFADRTNIIQIALAVPVVKIQFQIPENLNSLISRIQKVVVGIGTHNRLQVIQLHLIAVV
jgi:hypothetical protein